MSEVPARVMVDIETLGLEPGSVILSIGAVQFGSDSITGQFYETINLTSCQDAGLEIDADTLEWWFDQGDDAQLVLAGGDSLEHVLSMFTEWYCGEEIWAYSPSFDCEHLRQAYDAVGGSAPWGYRDERDARTIMALPCAVDIERDGTKHHALDDAKHQARAVQRTLERINRTASGEVGAADD